MKQVNVNNSVNQTQGGRIIDLLNIILHRFYVRK